MLETVKLVNFESISALVAALNQLTEESTAANSASIIATAEANEAAALVEMPTRVISIFDGASNLYPFFSTMSNALNYIASNIALQSYSIFDPIYIKYFSKTALTVDIYSLNDSGIIVEATFDSWLRWKNFGGDLILATTLYDVKLERQLTNLTLEG